MSIFLKISFLFLVLLAGTCFSGKYHSFAPTDVVLVSVIGKNGDRMRLKIRNDRDSPIFLGYQRAKGTGPSIVGYRLVCNQNNVETDFGPDWHGVMALNPLEPGDELEFETTPVPKFKGKCYVAVGYYNNKEAVELLRKLGSNPNSYSVTEDENEFLKRSRERVILTL